MTRRTNAKLAGFTFLFYIVVGITSLSMAGRTHVTDVLTIFTSLSALVLGVTLYALTREQDADLALLGLACRFVEAIPTDDGKSNAIFFTVGSTIFAWLLLRGRLIPIVLARFGVLASVVLFALLLVQRGGWLTGATSWTSSLTWILWLPMLVFELWLALWLIVKGVATPSHASAASP